MEKRDFAGFTAKTNNAAPLPGLEGHRVIPPPRFTLECELGARGTLSSRGDPIANAGRGRRGRGKSAELLQAPHEIPCIWQANRKHRTPREVEGRSCGALAGGELMDDTPAQQFPVDQIPEGTLDSGLG